MEKLTLEEIQKIELELLIELNKICKKNNLHYTLAGGTLLGAIRHQGFIPWDDDIDVCMPREDYEKFTIFMKKNYKNSYIQCLFLEDTSFPFIKMIDTRIKIKGDIWDQARKMKYIWIDILPVDGLPSKKKKVKEIYKKAYGYRNQQIYAIGVHKGIAKSEITRKIKKLLRPYYKKFDHYYWGRKLNKLGKQYKVKDCKYVGIVTWGLYGVGERMPKSGYLNTVEVNFEGYKFPAPKCWDFYLKGIYGDYMELPPMEKRMKHNIQAYK